MAEVSNIEWTDSTVNFWWGCTKVSPGCDHCYAETWNDFRGNKQWGPGAPRRKIVGAVKMIRSLQRGAAKFFELHGRRRRVFLHSMSDVFDHEVPAEWTAEMFAEVEAADQLDIQLTTKRSGNVMKLIPAHWRNGGWPQHVGLIFSVTTQKEADRDIERLLKLKRALGIPWVGISVEPMLEPISLRGLTISRTIRLDGLTGYFSTKHGSLPSETIWHPVNGEHGPLPALDWVIVGGESGNDNPRPMHPDWVITIKEQCAATKVPFLFKQWGEWMPVSEMTRADEDRIYRPNRVARDGQDQSALNDIYGRHCTVEQITLHRDGTIKCEYPNGAMDMYRVGKRHAGRMLRGKTYTDFPRRAA